MIYNIKKLFFVIIALISFSLSAQTEKEVPISIELKDALFKIQKTFSFIGFHSTILEIYDLNGCLIKRRIKSDNYIIETFDNVSFYMNRGNFTHYYLSIFKNQLFGYFVFDDVDNDRLIISYVENSEIVKTKHLQNSK